MAFDVYRLCVYVSMLLYVLEKRALVHCASIMYVCILRWSAACNICKSEPDYWVAVRTRHVHYIHLLHVALFNVEFFKHVKFCNDLCTTCLQFEIKKNTLIAVGFSIIVFYSFFLNEN